ncbi:uracil-DNA glycosylase [bacterium]|nr:uracil-DNA glycosylase [bacterium]
MTKKSSVLEELYDLEQDVKKCTKCILFKTRKNTVFGEGSIKSVKIMFIGEGPGENEDLLGRPFVGKAGNLLTDIIEKGIKIKRDEVYITNIVKCRPPQNRNPEHIEVMSCINYLYKQIEIINPEVIVLLGAVALKSLFPKYGSITKYRGQFFNFILDKNHQYPTLATYHPSYLLRYPEYKREAWEDIKIVMKKLNIL